jgi:hypothetical protein
MGREDHNPLKRFGARRLDRQKTSAQVAQPLFAFELLTKSVNIAILERIWNVTGIWRAVYSIFKRRAKRPFPD